MAIPTYPFDDRFRVLVDEQYGWSCFVNTDEPFIKAFEDAGYSKKQVQDFVKNLKEKPLDELVCLALRDDSDESPALIVLQQRTSRDVFDRAILLCASDNPKDRALGVEIVMRKPGLHYRDEAVATVCRMAKLEADSEVLEVLAYALSHLDVEGRSEYLQSIATNPAAETRMAAAYSLSSHMLDSAKSALQLEQFSI